MSEVPPMIDRARRKLLPRLRIFVGCYFALIIALALGSLASTPFMAKRVRSFSESTYLVAQLPADDSRLQAWALAQPGVESFRIERRGGELWIGKQPPWWKD